MDRRISFSILLVLCAALESTVSAQALLTLERGQSYEMAREGEHWTTRIYVMPKADAAEAMKVAIRGVTIGTRSDPGLNDLFGGLRRIPEKGAITAFDVVTRDNAPISRGVYDILLNVAAGVTTQPMTIQITVPTAVLRQPASLVVSQVLSLLGSPSMVSSPLLVSETGRKSPAKLLIAQQDAFSDSAGVYDGRLQFDSVIVQPGETAPISYGMRGTFPLGSSKANLAITASEIESAISIPIEVRTRRTRWLLLIMIVLGLALGFFMRTALKQRIQFGETRQKAVELARKLEREREDIPDADFRVKIDRAIKTLLAAVSEARLDKPATLTEATAAAEKSLSDAQADLHKREEETAEGLKALIILVKTSWRLPKRVVNELQNAATALAAAQDLNKARDAAGARRLLDSNRESIAKTAFAYAVSFKDDLDFDRAIGRAGALVPANQSEAFSTAIANMTTLRDRIPKQFVNDDPETLKAVLTALDAAQDASKRLMGLLRLGIVETLRLIDAGLRAVQQDPSAEWKVAENRTTEFTELLRSAADDPLTAGLNARIDILFSAWQEAFRNQDADADAVVMAGRGELAAAIEHLPRRRGESIQGNGRALTQAKLQGMMDAMALEMASPSASPITAALFESFFPMPRKQLQAEVLEANTLRELLRARWLMTLLSAIALAVIGAIIGEWVGASQGLGYLVMYGSQTLRTDLFDEHDALPIFLILGLGISHMFESQYCLCILEHSLCQSLGLLGNFPSRLEPWLLEFWTLKMC